jgi:hypothetical protein
LIAPYGSTSRLSPNGICVGMTFAIRGAVLPDVSEASTPVSTHSQG